MCIAIYRTSITPLTHSLRGRNFGIISGEKYARFGKNFIQVQKRNCVNPSSATMNGTHHPKTAILPVDAQNFGTIRTVPDPDDLLDSLHIDIDTTSPDGANLAYAAEQLKSSDIPVAFPTETVYGLGADATRSAAVRGIYKAKQRPVDNPLIVHFASLKQLRDLLTGESSISPSTGKDIEDSIPRIYHPLISRFWPGPLTIILPNPPDSPLAPEVTAGLSTFGARIPRHILALSLIQQAGVPVAAPSANASTKPSPTAAEHVAHDLDGRIETILDGGPCDVGVESTVVDGLSDPPLVLRPGGVSIEQLRQCPGWESCEVGYKNSAEGGSKPKAPGMKYRHYSPKATVVLYEAGKEPPSMRELVEQAGGTGRVGVITTRLWRVDGERGGIVRAENERAAAYTNGFHTHDEARGFAGLVETLQTEPSPRASLVSQTVQRDGKALRILEISLGTKTSAIARGIFAALRELDREDVSTIFVEGIEESEGETAAAIMNRLRKAAEIEVAA